MAIELREWIRPGSSRLSLHSIDSKEEAIPTTRKPRFQFQSGWRFSLFAGAASCTLVFIVNLSVTIWALTQEEKNSLDQPILREGVCSEMRNLNTALHLVINALSSILLAASNFGMQCVSAPTRADVDKAHFAGKWLDIGVPSVHNLRRLPKHRVVLWGLLMLSSLPLHLFYNSVVFSSLATVGYNVWTAESTVHAGEQPEFFNRPWNATRLGGYPRQAEWEELRKLGGSNELEQLSNLECIRRYATSFQTSHQHVILVTNITQDADSVSKAVLEESAINAAYRIAWSYDWICGNKCYLPDLGYDDGACRREIPNIKKQASDWAPYCDKVKYCYSMPIDEQCQLVFAPYFMAFVLASNAIKAATLLYIALKPPEESLFVLGDAVESFLTVSDAFSTDGCLASVADIKKNDGKDWAGPRRWRPVRRRWGAAISRRRWKVGLVMYLISLSAVLSFLTLGLIRLAESKNLQTIWSLGFGTVTELTLISTSNNDIASSFNMAESVILANLPHFIFSGLYFQYNALFTGMLAAKEWSEFALKRKGLRVSSSPKGEQRSRYFLQLPYRWSVPLIFMSMLIHWLLSRSIFIVAIKFDDEFATTCGYSPIAMIVVVVAAVVMALAVIITGCRRLPTAMPVVGSCSLGIAAACHGFGGAERPDETLVPLRWGAMTQPGHGPAFEPGHCGFSGDYVEEPQPGGRYA